MYTFIYGRNEIVILSKDVIDFKNIKPEIFCKEKNHENVEIISLREFLNGTWFNRYTIKLAENLDITKVYSLNLGKETYKIDHKQYYKTNEFKKLYSYTGNDLGVTLFQEETLFKIWSPVATKVTVKLYVDDKTDIYDWYELEKGEKGVFFYRHPQNLKNKYYNFEVEVFENKNEVVDIYAKGVSCNGKRGFITDLYDTNPVEFKNHYFENSDHITDSIIYETHIRDLTMHKSSGVNNKGKFLGLAERNTKNNFGQATSIDHIVELGATHVHLLPINDFATVDESNNSLEQYNWGYDPLNYNVPEGSYSSNPNDPISRIKELKSAVVALHNVNLGVILDVVYNHTYTIDNSSFEKTVPGYYYRFDSLGNYSNGSGCGNEIATERFMVRKFIIDSIVHWVREYKIDGFRFDLMGLIDIKTMNYIRSALDNINPSIIMYGEGWTGGDSSLYSGRQAIKENANNTNVRIGYFSDDIRDGIKGDVFEHELSGFVNGGINSLEDVKFGIVGGVEHKGIDIDKLNKSKDFWAYEPTQVVSYVSSHDNLTLYDKLKITNKSATEDEIIKMNKLSAFILSISQGAMFMQGGEEFARSKNFNDNSYNANDEVNSIDWDNKHKNLELYSYYKGLIELRKSDDVFRLINAKDVRKRVSFGECAPQFLVVKFKPINPQYNRYVALVNARSTEVNYEFEDDGIYRLLVDENNSGTEMLNFTEHSVVVPPKTALFYARESEIAKKVAYTKKHKKNIGIIAGTITTIIAISKIIKKTNKNK